MEFVSLEVLFAPAVAPEFRVPGFEEDILPLPETEAESSSKVEAGVLAMRVPLDLPVWFAVPAGASILAFGVLAPVVLVPVVLVPVVLVPAKVFAPACALVLAILPDIGATAFPFALVFAFCPAALLWAAFSLLEEAAWLLALAPPVAP